jgi:hypothetical protein
MCALPDSMKRQCLGWAWALPSVRSASGLRAGGAERLAGDWCEPSCVVGMAGVAGIATSTRDRVCRQASDGYVAIAHIV